MKQAEVNKLAEHLANIGLRTEEVRRALFYTKGIKVAQITTAIGPSKEISK